jgi:hypothetical protein
MTNEEMNIAIAEACGLDVIQNPHGYKDRPEAWKTGLFTPKAAKQRRISWPSSATVKVIPDYCNDLNAMHEAERTSTIFKSWRATKTWMDNLCICSDLGRLPESAPDWAFVLQASSAQRAEAFLKTLGKWEE